MVDSNKVKKIKELYKNGNYKEIALFIEPNFRIYNIISEYDDLTEAERIIAAISYYIYRINNPLMEVYWNFEKKNIDLRSEMFHIGGLDEGIKELVESNNEYFKDNAKLFIDVDFLNNCNAKSILYLYNMGYKDIIIDGVKNYKINAGYLIEELLSIEEFKNSIITKDFLLHGFNCRYKNYFLNLPKDRRYLIGLYGAFIFGDNNYNDDIYRKYGKNLKELFKNNFPEFSDVLIDKLMHLYGKVTYQSLCYVVKEVIEDNSYLDKMQSIADKYFNHNIGIVLSFVYKYPKLSSRIFEDNNISWEIVSKIISLSNIGTLSNIDDLSVDDFLKCDIENYSYSFKDGVKSNNNIIGPLNLKDSIVLYDYCYGVGIIDKKGEWEEYFVNSSHYEKLKNIYSYDNNKLNIKDGMELLYDINASGDIVFTTENAGLIIWVPSVITNKQMNKMKEQLNKIRNIEGVEIYIRVANLEKENEFIDLNDDIPMDLDKAIESIKWIRVKDKLIKELNKE
ncbi:MAG: hypothetical protein VZS44_08440 [Bacilli bacterium]|nr:hypothetical protein [Bacilli bacterium]